MGIAVYAFVPTGIMGSDLFTDHAPAILALTGVLIILFCILYHPARQHFDETFIDICIMLDREPVQIDLFRAGSSHYTIFRRDIPYGSRH